MFTGCIAVEKISDLSYVLVNKAFKLILLLCVVVGSLEAAIYDGSELVFTQPNGEDIELRLYGDQFYAVTEDLLGYTVVFDVAAKAYVYAELSDDGYSLNVSEHRVGIANPEDLGLSKHIRIHARAAEQIAQEGYDAYESVVDQKSKWKQQKEMMQAYRNWKKQEETQTDELAGALSESDVFVPPASPPQNPPTLGDIIGLTILVDFSDEPARNDVTRADIDTFCNAPGGNWDNSGSVYDYYYIQSNGRLRYNNHVTEYVRVPHPFSSYNDLGSNPLTAGRSLISDAVAELVAKGYDFSGLTTSKTNIIATNLFWAGDNSGVWSAGLWPHRGTTATPISVGSGDTDMYIYDYQMTNIGATETPTLGPFCHENGHMLGKYLDYYDKPANASDNYSRGAGAYCMMAGGGKFSLTNPANISGYLKYHSGWVDAIELTSLTPPLRLSADVDGTVVYKYTNPTASTEYFLIENRSHAGGWEAGGTVPDSGLLISHIDESVEGNDDEQRTEALHFEHSIEQADGLFHLERGQDDAASNKGDDADLFHAGGVGPKTSFDDNTLPSARWWKNANGIDGSGDPSGFVVHDISSAGSTMTFVYGTGTPSAASAIGLSTTVLEQACAVGENAEAQTFSIHNTGGGTLSYTIAVQGTETWVTPSLTAGTATTEFDTVTISYTSSALAVGTHSLVLVVTNTDTSFQKTIPVTLEVRSLPSIITSMSSLRVDMSSNETVQRSFSLAYSTVGTLAYTASIDPALAAMLSPATGTLTLFGEQAEMIVSFDTTGIAEGVYQGNITITDTNAVAEPVSIPVMLVVTSPEIVVTDPHTAGVSWVRGGVYTINWTASAAVTNTVTIELWKGHAFHATMATGIAKTGPYSWAIPTDQIIDTDYSIRVIDGNGLFDISDVDFAIQEPVSTSLPYTESFNTSLGIWTQSSSDNIDWVRQTGAPPDANGVKSGPKNAEEGSHYLFIQDSWWNTGGDSDSGTDAAFLEADFNLSSVSQAEFSLYYHMYGASINALHIDVSRDSGQTWQMSVWSQVGEEQTSATAPWEQAVVDMTPYISVSTRIRIRGIASASYSGNIAIDSFSLTGSGTPTPYAVTLPEGLSLFAYAGSGEDTQQAFQNGLTGGLNDLEYVRWVDNTTGLTKELYYDIFLGAWVNEIGDLVAGEGYLVNTTGGTTVTFSGVRLATEGEHTVPAGYSLLGYRGATNLSSSALTVFSSLITDTQDLVRWIDGSGAVKELYHNGSEWVDEIGIIQANQGYIIKKNAGPTYFTFPSE